MDYLLLSILAIYSIKGFVKGFVKMFLSLFSSLIIFIIAYYISKSLSENFVLVEIYNKFALVFENMFNDAIPGNFQNIEDLLSAVALSNSVFIAIIRLVSKNISIDGNLTAGQILAPSFAKLTYNILLFIIVFIALFIIVKFINILLTFIFKKMGVGVANRFIGLLLGVFKGFIVTTFIYIILTTFASLNLSSWLLEFVQKGVISNYLYPNFGFKFFDFVYDLF